MIDPQPRNIRMLIGDSGRPYTLIELEESEIRFTLLSSGWRHLSVVSTENIFCETLLDDFASKAPSQLYPVLRGRLYQDQNLVRIIMEKEKVQLSQNQLNTVWRLIENIVEGDLDREFEWSPISGHIDYVWAIIDDNMYWSLYDSNINDTSRANREWRQWTQGYVNRELLLLTYELINLSPITVGGERNPIMTP